MSSFRTTYQKWTKAQGGYVKGRWVEGGVSVSAFQATIQPLGMSAMNALSAMLQGRHISSAVKIYTSEVLAVAGENGQNGDEVVFQNQRYLVVARDVWQSGVINHYRYQAVRVNNDE